MVEGQATRGGNAGVSTRLKAAVFVGFTALGVGSYVFEALSWWDEVPWSHISLSLTVGLAVLLVEWLWMFYIYRRLMKLDTEAGRRVMTRYGPMYILPIVIAGMLGVTAGRVFASAEYWVPFVEAVMNGLFFGLILSIPMRRFTCRGSESSASSQ